MEMGKLDDEDSRLELRFEQPEERLIRPFRPALGWPLVTSMGGQARMGRE